MPDEFAPLALVTGATGAVGSHVARRLLDEGWRVRALVRSTSDTRLLESWDVERVEGDLDQPAGAFTPFLEDADYVFHCAAMVSDWGPLEDMVRINVDGTRSLAEAAIACGRLKRFVHISSVVVFGMQPQHNIDETAPMIHTGDHYNLTKIRAEKMLQQLMKERGLPAAILRPPYIYGIRDRSFLPRVLQNLRDGRFKFVGSGLNPLTLCWVGNVADAAYRAAVRPEAAGEIFVVTDGEATTRVRLVEVICEELGYPMPRTHVPTWLVRALCPIFEGLHSLRRTEEPPLINRSRLKFMVPPFTFSIEKARRLLGYEPKRTTEAGLRETLAWFRENRPDLLPKG